MIDNFITPIIKLTDACNFSCDFCYYSQKALKLKNKILPLELLKKIIEEVVDINLRKNKKLCHLIFHGGEPLLAGVPYFEKIIMIEKNIKTQHPDIIFENSIETNGFLLNDEWFEFFKSHDFGIGISIDGPDSLNYHKNKTDSSTNQKVLNNIHQLNKLNIPFGVMSVITNSHLKHANELYNFYIENKITNVGFCYCFNKDTNDSVDTHGLALFLIDFFNLYFYGENKLRVREYEEMIKKILHKNNNLCLFCNRKRCGNYPTIDSDGNVFFCDFATEKDKAIGNIRRNSINEIIDSTEWQDELKKAMLITTNTCNTCRNHDICGGICYRSDIPTEGGNIKNYFCETYPIVMEYIRDKIKPSI